MVQSGLPYPINEIILLLAQRARQDGRWQRSIREHVWCTIRWAFDPVRSQRQLQGPSLRTTGQGCINLGKLMLRGPFMAVKRFAHRGLRKTRERANLICPRQTAQAPGSRTRTKVVVSMCRLICQTLRSCSTPLH